MNEIFQPTKTELFGELEELLMGGDAVLEVGDVPDLDLPHLLSVKIQLEGNENEFNPPTTLWLDGGNFFNPYRISELAKRLGRDPDETLKNIYISRAFTCHQMISLISEKMWEAIENRMAKLVVVTNLPSLFINSDLSGDKAIRSMEFILDELGKFQDREEALLLTSRLAGSSEDNELLLRLKKLADVIINVESRNNNTVAKVKKKSSETTHRTIFGSPPWKTAPLEKYLGSG